MLTFFFRLSHLEFVEVQQFLQEYKYSLPHRPLKLI